MGGRILSLYQVTYRRALSLRRWLCSNSEHLIQLTTDNARLEKERADMLTRLLEETRQRGLAEGANQRILLEHMEKKGLLNCRGVLEEMLWRCHEEGPDQSKPFIASEVCDSLQSAKIGRGRHTRILIETAELVFTQFPTSIWTKWSNKKHGLLYKQLYKKT